MKVENGNILLDDEIVILDDVAMINVAQVGSPFDKPTFALSIVYPDGIGRTIATTDDKSKLKLFRQLNKLGKEIIKEGNDNFANLGIALINMHYIDHIEYYDDYTWVEFYSRGQHVNAFNGTTNQLKRVSAKAEVAFEEHYHSRVQQL